MAYTTVELQAIIDAHNDEDIPYPPTVDDAIGIVRQRNTMVVAVAQWAYTNMADIERVRDDNDMLSTETTNARRELEDARNTHERDVAALELELRHQRRLVRVLLTCLERYEDEQM